MRSHQGQARCQVLEEPGAPDRLREVMVSGLHLMSRIKDFFAVLHLIHPAFKPLEGSSGCLSGIRGCL